MSNIDKFLDWYRSINKNKFNTKYSPHKPITILFALSKALKDQRWIEYNQDRNFLEDFIGEFSNFKSTPNCLQPLYRLNNDNKSEDVWEISPTSLSPNKSGDISQSEATKENFKAGFSEEYYNYFSQNKALTARLIENIIDDNFTHSLKDYFYSLLGFESSSIITLDSEDVSKTITVSKRDPNFPRKILALYDNQCCFCRLKINFNLKSFNMEAAHIKWKARGGDCIETNGMSLCPTHHATFDRGLWTLDRDYKIELSKYLMIKVQSDIFFKPFVGQSIRESIMDPALLPDQENLEWHRESIFKS
ncbi:MAG: putative restriction endonuclease [Bacteriovoracaceae bacterium]|jgi:putative restriction endonuclease